MTVDKSVDTETTQKKKRGFVSFDIGDLKGPWEAFCKRNNTTPSKAIREIIGKLTGAGEGNKVFVVQHESLPDSKSKKRMVIRWTKSEFEAIEKQSPGYGSPSMWVVDLVRANLTKTNQFGMDEVSALWESSAQLMKIGSNLNQIARAINRNQDQTDLARLELLEELRLEIRRHTAKVADLLNANLSRWDIK
jgi:hypothetical protein